VSPLYLIGIFVMFVLQDVIGYNFATGERKPTAYVTDLVGPAPSEVARLSVALIVLVVVFFTVMVAQAGKRWDNQSAGRPKGNPP
jgi:hypothetical protein